MSEWLETTLSEVAEIVPGYAFKGEHFGDDGALVVKIKDIKPPIVSLDNAERVSLSHYDLSKLQRFRLHKEQYVVAMTGATIGKIGRLKEDCEVYVNQRVAKILPKNIDENYLYACLICDDFYGFVQNNIDSNSAQENISGNSLGRFPIFVPPASEQKAIANVLSNLDDKIDLLHRQNKTLEAMAETLFRQWFDGREQDGTISQLISIQNGYAFKSKNFLESGTNGVLKIKNISGGVIDILSTDYIEDYVAASTSSRFRVLSGDVLIGMTGAEIGKLGIVPKTNKSLWLNQRVGLLSEKFEGSKYLAYLQLKSDFGQDYIENTATGSAQPNISGDGIEKCNFPLLSSTEIESYSAELDYLYKKIISNLGQMALLEKLRDTLLPKLMSGEVRVAYDQQDAA